MGGRAVSAVASLVTMLIVAACSTPPANEAPAKALLADQSAEFAARVAQRRAKELQQLIAIDRQSLGLAERTEQATRSLYEAGRVPQADLAQAQEQSRRCRAQLAKHEQELAELSGAR